MGASSSHDEQPAACSNRRIGSYYALASALAAIGSLAAFQSWWSLLLLWPATALGLAAAGYFRLGPGIYRKANGKIPLLSQGFFAPALVGQHLSHWHYRRQCLAWDRAAERVLIGRQLNAAEAARAVAEEHVTAVLDLTAEFSESAPFLSLAYRNLPILDLTAPTPAQLQEAVAFLDEHARADGTVYVHCKIGYSRSAAVIGAWLLASGRAGNPAAAVAALRAVRPTLVVRPEAMAALRAFHAALPRAPAPGLRAPAA